jgi:phosphosulfolactate synthase
MIDSSFGLRDLPDRPQKPRAEGLTFVLDKGFSPRQAEDLVAVAEGYVDIVKLGWGTAVITPGLKDKLAVYRDAGIPVYFGGTLFEAYYLRGQLDDYRRLLGHLGVEHAEVSDGSITIPHAEKLEAIRTLARDVVVVSEVGSKDQSVVIPPYKWVELIQAELEAGSWKVICEARESGTAGIFRPTGEIRSGLIDEIVHMVGQDKLIFEAPQKVQQVWFLRRLGPNVNLGNIAPEEVIPLETLRLGLRGDTLLDYIAA